jgi:hypothetical protein
MEDSDRHTDHAWIESLEAVPLKETTRERSKNLFHVTAENELGDQVSAKRTRCTCHNLNNFGVSLFRSLQVKPV